MCWDPENLKGQSNKNFSKTVVLLGLQGDRRAYRTGIRSRNRQDKRQKEQDLSCCSYSSMPGLNYVLVYSTVVWFRVGTKFLFREISQKFWFWFFAKMITSFREISQSENFRKNLPLSKNLIQNHAKYYMSFCTFVHQISNYSLQFINGFSYQPNLLQIFRSFPSNVKFFSELKKFSNTK